MSLLDCATTESVAERAGLAGGIVGDGALGAWACRSVPQSSKQDRSDAAKQIRLFMVACYIKYDWVNLLRPAGKSARSIEF
jgi:hypothetical protein